jgi:predicted transposase YbfD/YdcC
VGILPASSFQDYFATLTDPRCPDAPNSRPQWMDMLLIAGCAVMCGADGWEAIEEYGTSQAEWFATFLDLPPGMPGHDTFRRVLSRLAPEALPQCFIAWPAALSEAAGGDIVSIAGKTLRHSFDQATGQAAIHLVRAWASANRLVGGQLTVEEKANESTAIPKLIQMLDIAGAPVTIDAMGCQKESAKVMTEREADYVLALKENHPTLSGDVPRFFDEATATAFADIAHAYHAPVDGAHGRIETRRYWITSDIAWLGAKASWAKLHSIGMVESCRAVGETGQVETRDCLTSLPAQGVRFAQAVRQHWGMENALPWVLDVSCNDEAGRLRQDQGAQSCSMLRHMALNLLRQERRPKRGIKARRKRAGWDRDYLLHVLAG